jgi:hypothetical protein
MSFVVRAASPGRASTTTLVRPVIGGANGLRYRRHRAARMFGSRQSNTVSLILGFVIQSDGLPIKFAQELQPGTRLDRFGYANGLPGQAGASSWPRSERPSHSGPSAVGAQHARAGGRPARCSRKATTTSTAS